MQSTGRSSTDPVHFVIQSLVLYWSGCQHMRPSSGLSAALSRGADTTLTEQLSARYSEQIRQRLMAPGTRLPSVRECARRHGVSAYTVVAAYDQLLAQGLVEARRQRGFFVRETTPEARAAAQTPPRAPLPISATTLMRGMFQPPGALPLPGLGTPVLPVPRGEDGPDLAVMGRLIEAHHPRLYVTVSVLHNPTGACLSLGAAHRLLKLAQLHDLHIVEDDSYSHLAPAHLPRMAALDALERTIYVSGFSKILAPNWRVGYIAAPPALVDRFIDTKLLTTLTTPGLTEQALAHCLEHGLLRRHAERVMLKLDAARARSVKLAESHGCRFASPPRGLFCWVDVGMDTERLARD